MHPVAKKRSGETIPQLRFFVVIPSEKMWADVWPSPPGSEDYMLEQGFRLRLQVLQKNSRGYGLSKFIEIHERPKITFPDYPQLSIF